MNKLKLATAIGAILALLTLVPATAAASPGQAGAQHTDIVCC